MDLDFSLLAACTIAFMRAFERYKAEKEDDSIIDVDFVEIGIDELPGGDIYANND